MNDAFGTPRRRIVVVDGATGAALAAIGVVEMLAEPPGGSAAFYLPATIVSTLAVSLRRLQPDWALALATGSVGLAALLEVDLVPYFTPFIAVIVSMASMALHANRPARSWSLVVAIGAMVAVVARFAEWPVDLIYFGLQLAFAWGAGYAVRVQLNRVARVSAEAATREAALELEVRNAIGEERARMAREIHDIVGHGISLMVVHAGAAEQHADEPDTVRSSMTAIQEVGRQAVADMARLLHVLRSDHAEIGLGPQPGVADIERLCDAAREAGTTVTLDVDVDVDAVPATVGLTAYRVVQEALTNAVRHAAGAAVDVDVRTVNGNLRLRVANEPGSGSRGVGTGHGLLGLAERVRLFGGTLRAEGRPGGRFEVEARIPLRGATPG